MEWQPIDTAPHDGSRTLLWLPGRGANWGYWGIAPDDITTTDPCWHDGRYAYSHPWGWPPPTHWLPIEPPPGMDDPA